MCLHKQCESIIGSHAELPCALEVYTAFSTHPSLLTLPHNLPFFFIPEASSGRASLELQATFPARLFCSERSEAGDEVQGLVSCITVPCRHPPWPIDAALPLGCFHFIIFIGVLYCQNHYSSMYCMDFMPALLSLPCFLTLLSLGTWQFTRLALEPSR